MEQKSLAFAAVLILLYAIVAALTMSMTTREAYQSVLHVRPRDVLHVKTHEPDVASARARSLLTKYERNGVRIIETEPSVDVDDEPVVITDLVDLKLRYPSHAVSVVWPLEPHDGGRRLYLLAPYRPAGVMPTTFDELQRRPDVCIACSSHTAKSILLTAFHSTRENVRVELDRRSLVESTIGSDTDGCIACLWMSPASAAAFAADEKVVVIPYDDDDFINATNIAASIPWATMINEDVRRTFRRSKGERIVMGLIAAPPVLGVGQAGAHADSDIVRAVLDTALADRDVLSWTTHAELLHMSVHSRTRELISKFSASLRQTDGDLHAGRPTRAVLEQFQQRRLAIEIVPDKHVRGFHTSPNSNVPAYGAMALPSPRINGMRLDVGDRVSLRSQENARENGDYVVTHVDGEGALLETHVRTKILFPHGVSVVLADEWTFEGVADVAFDPSVGLRVMHLGRPAKVSRVDGNRVAFVMDVLLDPIEDVKFDPMSYCWEDSTVHIRELCIEKGFTWDRPCKHDAECPFYQTNRAYMNARGGCAASGHCEMPLGVEKVSYKTFRGRPWCHGCNGIGGAGDCCATAPSSDDYAFPLDRFEKRRTTM